MDSKTKVQLTNTQIERLVQKHFPDSQATQIKELTDGMFNAAYLIEGTGALGNGIVLKVGPKDETEILTYEKAILRTEVEVYRLLEGKPIPVPKLYASDFTRSEIPNDYFFMERMDGVTWQNCAEQLPVQARPQLLKQLGRYNAAVHSVEGKWFGYIKEDQHFHFDTWGGAFSAMMNDILSDGRKRNNDLPYAQIEKAILVHRNLLDAVKTPRLVDFDMWAGNVFLKEDDYTHISGIVDFERCFFGDPYADFTSAMFLFSDVEQEPEFCIGYSEVSGAPLSVSADDRIRMDLYRLYMAVILHVETYRYDKDYAAFVEKYCIDQIAQLLKDLGI